MIITTSWDDGHPLDMKLLELLEKYKLKATFYVPLSNPENEVMDKNMLREISKYQEIGAHTLTHTYLNRLNEKQAKKEIGQSKVEIEQITGNPVTAFCYPGGKFSKRDIKIVEQSGYLFGRTTKLLMLDSPKSNLLNTTVQAYNHSCKTLLCHCLKNRNLFPLRSHICFKAYNKNFSSLAEQIFKSNQNTDATFHLWGHSWEIEKYNLWYQLEELFKLISNQENITYLNNTETWKYNNL